MNRVNLDTTCFQVRSHDLTWRQLLKGTGIVLLLVGLLLVWRQLDIKELHTLAEELPALPVILFLCILPTVGFPVSWLHLIAGVRFGFVYGMAVVALSTAAQHFIAWRLVQWKPRLFGRRLKSWRERFKDGSHRDITILTSLLPGMPYTVQLYLLPLLGVPLLMLLSLSTLLHTARAIVTIYFGDVSDDLSVERVVFLVCYYVSLSLVCAWTARRLQKHLKNSAP